MFIFFLSWFSVKLLSLTPTLETDLLRGTGGIMDLVPQAVRLPWEGLHPVKTRKQPQEKLMIMSLGKHFNNNLHLLGFCLLEHFYFYGLTFLTLLFRVWEISHCVPALEFPAKCWLPAGCCAPRGRSWPGGRFGLP